LISRFFCWQFMTRDQADAHARHVIDAFAEDIQVIFASEAADAKAAARLVDAIRKCVGVSSALQYGASVAKTLNFKRRRASAASNENDVETAAKPHRNKKM
jgi:hypothetical protein